MLKLLNYNDLEDVTSYLIYLAQLNETDVFYVDIEYASKTILPLLKRLDSNYEGLFYKILNSIDANRYFKLNTFKVYVSNTWLFRVILLNSVKDFELLSCEILELLIRSILGNVDLLNYNSVFLLKTLQRILLKRPDVLTPKLSYKILLCNNYIATSPLNGFKHYIHSISKISLDYLTYDQRNSLCKASNIPFKGIETIDIAKHLTDGYIESNRDDVLVKIHRLFQNNVRSKDASVLYNRLLHSYSFEGWRVEVWPYFLDSLVQIEFDGEYFQSYIKYWIVSTVNAYRDNLFRFIHTQPVDLRIKSLILLETRRKGSIVDCKKYLLEIFYNITTADVGLKISSTYYKKSLLPEPYELKILLDFLYSHSNNYLNLDQVKCIKMSLSQVVSYAHIDLKRSGDEKFWYYADFFDKLYRFCHGSLNTEFFEVGAQVLMISLDTLKGSHSDLSLMYKLEKKDHYEAHQNFLYRELCQKNCWRFDKDKIISRLKYCLIKNQASSQALTSLILKHYPNVAFMTVETFQAILNNVRHSCTLHNIDRIENCSVLLSPESLKSCFTSTYYLLLETCIRSPCDQVIFESTLCFVMFTVTLRSNIDSHDFSEVMLKTFNVIRQILEDERSSRTKVIETFINKVLVCLIQNMDMLCPIDEEILEILVFIIEASNMKKCVTLSAEAIGKFIKKYEEKTKDTSFKLKLLNQTLEKLLENPKLEMKIRRNPQTRLIIHAICLGSEKNPLVLEWSIEYLLNCIKHPQSSDYSVSAALHCLELLVSDNTLHNSTLHYIPEITKCSIDTFTKSSWIIRNADLQLVKAIIERFYGVSMGSNKRPKSIQHFLTLFPDLATYFFAMLSMEILDGRAMIVFQFFLESQVGSDVFPSAVDEILEYFQCLLVKIVKTHSDNYGKWAALSYVSLTRQEDITVAYKNVVDFIKENYTCMKKNILWNFVVILSELYKKDECSSSYVSVLSQELWRFLKQYDSPVFDFLLLKILTETETFEKITAGCLETDLTSRIFLHNYIPHLFINTKPSAITNTTDTILSLKLPKFIHVKILSILVRRLEKREFSNEDINSVINVLFKHSVNIHNNIYLSICYFKVLLLFSQYCKNPNIYVDMKFTQLNHLYNTMICVLYSSLRNVSLENNDFITQHYFTQVYLNEEINKDILSTSGYLKTIIPKNYLHDLCKLIFYHSLFFSTSLETCHFISVYTGKSYCNILGALSDFLLNIAGFLGKEDVTNLYVELRDIVKQLSDGREGQGGFYEAEGDNIISFEILDKLLRIFEGK